MTSEQVRVIGGDDALFNEVYELTVTHSMFTDDDREPLDYLPERENAIGEYLATLMAIIERARRNARVDALQSAADELGDTDLVTIWDAVQYLRTSIFRGDNP